MPNQGSSLNLTPIFTLAMCLACLSAPAQKRMAPHITSAAGDFTSRVLLANPTASSRAYRLHGYNLAGELVRTIEGSLEPLQSMTSDADALFEMNLSHFEIEGDPEVAVSIIYQRDGEGTGTAHVHESAIQSTAWRIFPGNPAVTWDGLAAVNVGGTPADIQVTQWDASGQVVQGPLTIFSSVAPNAKVLYLFAADFAAVEETFFEISSNEPLAVMALRGNLASDFLWENRAIPIGAPDQEGTRAIVHVTSATGGFQSQILLSNPSENEKSFTLLGYGLTGNLESTATGSVAAGQTQFGSIQQLFGADITHFDISNDTELLVQIRYQRNQAPSGPAHVPTLSRFGRNWRIYPGKPSVTWDGLAVVNRGQAPADIQVWQLDEHGSLIRGPIKALDQLPPSAKGLYLFSSDFSPEENAYFEITADEPLAVMALRGNHQSDFIWENQALLLPEPDPGPQPPPRIDYAFVYNPVKRVSVMSGGYDVNFDLLADTWLWNGRSWRSVETEDTLLARSHHGGAFDGRANQVVVFGGVKSRLERRNDFRVLDGGAWLDFAGHPDIPAQDGELVFDAARDCLVLTVSNGNTLQTWEHHENQWLLKNTATNPGRRIDQGLVYDPERQRVVMFGGFGVGNQIVDETWEYDGKDWMRVATAASPPALAGMAMFYDSHRNRVVFFGGMNADRAVMGETWTYDGATWVRLETAQSPEPRWVAFAAFDPKRAVATLFGGEGMDENGLIMFGDTWEFDGSDWRKNQPF